MVCKYFCEQLGNQFTVGVGERKIAELWFKVEGESEVPLTKEEVETLLGKFMDYLNEKHPITDEMAELYGDSDSRIKKIRMLNKASHGELSEEEERRLMAEMMLGSLSCGCGE